MATDGFTEEFAELFQTVDASGITADGLYKSSAMVDKAGRYHFLVESAHAEAKPGKSSCVKFKLKVLAGEPSDQVGRVLYYRVWTSQADGSAPKPKSVEYAVRLASALGIVSDDTINDSSELGIEWQDAVGCQCVGKVTEKDQKPDDLAKYGKQFEIAYGEVWPLGHPDVAGVPVDKASAAMASVPDDDDDLSDFV